MIEDQQYSIKSDIYSLSGTFNYIFEHSPDCLAEPHFFKTLIQLYLSKMHAAFAKHRPHITSVMKFFTLCYQYCLLNEEQLDCTKEIENALNDDLLVRKPALEKKQSQLEQDMKICIIKLIAIYAYASTGLELEEVISKIADITNDLEDTQTDNKQKTVITMYTDLTQALRRYLNHINFHEVSATDERSGFMRKLNVYSEKMEHLRDLTRTLSDYMPDYFSNPESTSGNCYVCRLL